jgi:hypothetical protein
MIKNWLSATSLALAMFVSTQDATFANGMVGREVAAPSRSAACMTDHGPSRCDEPMWVYGSHAEVSRYKDAF